MKKSKVEIMSKMVGKNLGKEAMGTHKDAEGSKKMVVEDGETTEEEETPPRNIKRFSLSRLTAIYHEKNFIQVSTLLCEEVRASLL